MDHKSLMEARKAQEQSEPSGFKPFEKFLIGIVLFFWVPMPLLTWLAADCHLTLGSGGGNPHELCHGMWSGPIIGLVTADLFGSLLVPVWAVALWFVVSLFTSRKPRK